MTIYRVRNILAQLAFPDRKIFFIGFNKTGTVSSHQFMCSHRIRSAHWTETGTAQSPRIAEKIAAYLNGGDLTGLHTYLRRWTAYSDLSGWRGHEPVEGGLYFRELHALYPKAFFILNDRDTDDWLRSRRNHNGGGYLDGYVRRSQKDAHTILCEWRRMKEAHVADATDYFRGRPHFLHYRVDRDPPEKIVTFLAPTFILDADLWPHANRTSHNDNRK